MWIQTRGWCWLWWMGLVLVQRSWSFRCVAGKVRMEVWFSALKLCIALLSISSCIPYSIFCAYMILILDLTMNLNVGLAAKSNVLKGHEPSLQSKLVSYGDCNVVGNMHQDEWKESSLAKETTNMFKIIQLSFAAWFHRHPFSRARCFKFMPKRTPTPTRHQPPVQISTLPCILYVK